MTGQAEPNQKLLLLLAVGPTPAQPHPRQTAGNRYPAVGLLSLQATLRAHGYRAVLFDLMRNQWDPGLLSAETLATGEPPLAVGISTFTETCERAYEVAGRIRDLFPTTAVIFGGPHVSFMPAEALRAGADYVVLFEGESTVIPLLEHIKRPRALPVDRVQGIAYLRDGEVVITPERAQIRNLDTLPFSPEALAGQEGELRTHLLTSRGCPGRCIFCASGAFSAHRYRRHSAEYVVSMMHYAVAKLGNPPRFGFVDDCFAVDRKRVTKVFDWWAGAGPSVEWDARCRVDQLDGDFIAHLARLGCRSLHVGVESAEQAVLDAIGKRLRFDDFLVQFEHLVRSGIWPRCSFIIGHHCDTLVSIEKTLMLAATIEISGLGAVAIGISTPFPGTELRQTTERMGVLSGRTRWSHYTLTRPIYATAEFSADDLRKALFLFHSDKGRVARGGFLTRAGGHPEIASFGQRIERWASQLAELKLARSSSGRAPRSEPTCSA